MMGWVKDHIGTVATVAAAYFSGGESLLASGADAAAEDAGTALLANGADAAAEDAGTALLDIGADPVTGIVTGATAGEVGVADAAGAGFTFDASGEVIPNEFADSSIAANIANNTPTSIPDLGSVNPVQANDIMSAIKANTIDKLPGPLKTLAEKAVSKGLIPALANLAGTALKSNAATGAASLISNAATSAGSTLSNAALEASGLQSKAATQAADTLSGAATSAADLKSSNDLQAQQSLASAYGWAGRNQSAAAQNAGNTLSAGYTGAAGTLAGGYATAAGQKVAGLEGSIGTAQDILAKQTANQQPYMQAGTDALKTLSEGLKPGGQYNRAFTMQDAQNSEAYKFALGQGTEAINNASAAGGLQLSSANIQSLGKFAEGTASQFEQQAFDQWLAQNNLSLGALQNMVQTGQISTAQLQSALSQAGISIETAQQAIGQAQAEGTMGAATANAAGTVQSAQAQAAAGQQAANYSAAGDVSAMSAASEGQKEAANDQATGIKDAAQAQAAGQVGSAGYSAGGITDAAKANAAAQVAAANATGAGKVSSANTLGSGISNTANILTTQGAQQYLMGGGSTSTGAADSSVGSAMGGVPIYDTSGKVVGYRQS